MDPRVRYERKRPGELLHVDTKKLGRSFQVGKRIRRDGIQRWPRAGWHYLHVAIDIEGVDGAPRRLTRSEP